ncbi:MAG: four helix bundle protein, partial [bacterium]|nr:four helix bundle protein [bacterium]
MKESVLKDKSYQFALEIIKLAQFLMSDKKEFVLSKQVLRSGTAIGALIREAEFGQSKSDFINKMSIALKEANETIYWLELLNESNFIKKPDFD